MEILKNVPLNIHSTFKLGGSASYFIVVNDVEELKEAVAFAKSIDQPHLVAGGFSNMLFGDGGYEGVVIKNGIGGYEFFEKNGSVFVGAGAGVSWDQFVQDMIDRDLYGVENLSGIPGSVGATPIQNVGAYGTEVSDVISWVEVLNTETMETELFTNRMCDFDYRDSFFKSPAGKKYIVTEVGFKLETHAPFNISYKDLRNYFNEGDTKPTLQSVRNAVLGIRKKKFPDLNTYGCGGSFFKNPIVSERTLIDLRKRFGEDVPCFKIDDDTYKVPLAWILEHAVPWKGVRRGSVGVHSGQPLVLVHYGKGSAKEMKQLADDITLSISSEANILITPEVSFVGKF